MKPAKPKHCKGCLNINEYYLGKKVVDWWCCWNSNFARKSTGVCNLNNGKRIKLGKL